MTPMPEALIIPIRGRAPQLHAESWVAPPLELPPVQSPTMGIWSSLDFALTESQMSSSDEQVAGPWRYERVDGAGHWMQLEQPSAVTDLLVDFLPN